MPGLIGSDLLRVRPDYRVIANPFAAGEPVVVVPAIRPDVAVLHALRAEPDGTAVFSAHGDAVLLARAAGRVLVTAELVYDGAATLLGSDEQRLPGIYVDALAKAPLGARPLGLAGHYAADAAEIDAYARAVSSGILESYLPRFLSGAADPAGVL